MKKIIFIAAIALLGGCATIANKGVGESDEMKAAQTALSAGEYDKAYKLYLEAEEKYDDPLAQFTLGNFFRSGWGREPDAVIACQWFGKSAEGGVAFGQHLFAECLERGVHQKEAPLLAAHWYTEAAKGGHVVSNCHLGWLHMVGTGVEKNPNRALELCAAATARSPAAMTWMGRYYLEGDPSIRNNTQAWGWFKQAAEYRQPAGFYYLGLMLEQGMVEDMPAEAALGMYEQAAARGYISAYYPTGRLYFESRRSPETGLPTEENLAKAYMWLIATKQRVEDETQLQAAEALLQQVLKIMPESWVNELNERVERHFRELQS